uniref:Uncharacterized protein n=1 Tax=Arundo donax TaxID=35708 RepID=A0A0A8Y9H6_ARUDO
MFITVWRDERIPKNQRTRMPCGRNKTALSMKEFQRIFSAPRSPARSERSTDTAITHLKNIQSSQKIKVGPFPPKAGAF